MEGTDKIEQEYGTVVNHAHLQYDPLLWGWELTGFSLLTPNKEDKCIIERDTNSQDKGFDIKLCGITPEDQKCLIAYGPNEVIGIDEDDYLVLGCFSHYHCNMATEYAWFINGLPVKEGRKASLLFAYQPGDYQCVVKINDNIEKSEIVNVVESNQHNPVPGSYEQREQIGLNDICDAKPEDSVNEVDPSSITKEEMVGQGQFGIVYKAMWRGTDVAVKCITLAPEHLNASVERTKELQICRKIRHPNLLLLMGYCRNGDELWLVSPYIKGSNLEKIIFKNPPPFQIDQEAKPYMLRQVASGCNYLHAEQIIHQDLKPANILVEKRTYHTVICDFGGSSFTATAITQNAANAGTMMYQHKESILGKRAEPYMDVYAIGCIILETYTGRRLWPDVVNPGQLVAKIITNIYPETGNLDKHSKVKNIVQDCFKEPDIRITMSDVMLRLDALVDKDKY